jgi:WD40 repeat protein
MEARTMKFESRVTSLAFSPDSNWLAAGSEDSSVGLIQVIGDNEAKIALSSKVAALAFSPDGRWLAAQSTDGLIRVLEPIGIDRGATSPSWVNILNRVSTNNQMIFSPDGKWVAVTGDPNVVILETISAREIAKGGPGGMASFSPDSQLLAIGNGQSKSIQVVESSSGNLKHRLLLDGTPTAVAVSNGCRLMAVAIELSEDNFKVCIYEPSKPEPVRTWDYKVGADRLEFSSGARELFVGRGDGPEADASIIDLETGQDFSCTAAAFNLTGRLMAVCVGETVDIMELATGQELSHITINGKVQSICFSNDDRYLFALATSSTPRLSSISGDVPASVRIVNLASGSEICSVTASLSFPSPHRRGWIESSGSNIVHSGKDFPLVISQHWLSRESSDVPDYFAKLLQLQSGLIVDRRLRSRNDSEWLDLWNSFIDDAKNAPSEPLYFHSILQWWSTAPELKAVSPWVNMPLREAIGQSLMGAWEPWTPFECAERAPWHPLTPVCLARWYGMLSWSPDDRKFEVINPVFLARLTLNRLRVADATLYGKDVLASYAKTATKIMVELNEVGGGKILAKEIEEMRAMSWEDDNGKQ